MNRFDRSLRPACRRMVYGLLLPALFMTTACAVRTEPAGPIGTTATMRMLEGLTPPQLRRLAGIVEMRRTGEPVWVAMKPESGMRFCQHAAFASPDSAAVAGWADDQAVGHQIYGPFETPEGPEWDMEVVGVEITMRDVSADTLFTKTVDVANVDAIFMTPAATERFLLPYVMDTYGPEFATEWYRGFLRMPKVPPGHWTSCPTWDIFLPGPRRLR